MIRVLIPNNNIPERKYAIKMVLTHFLGIEYGIEEHELDNTILSWGDKKIIFTDVLWMRKKDMSYLQEKWCPVVTYVQIPYINENDLPVIYGDGKIESSPNSIFCGIDVWASIFFMLTRWEEYVVEKKDAYDRFIGKNSVAYKYGYLSRPIVNEYVEMIWNMMTSLGYRGCRKERYFSIVPTHDVDHPYMRFRFFRTTKNIFKSIASRDMDSIQSYLRDYFKDPYDVYSFLMDVSEEIGTKSRFYFMSSSPNIIKKETNQYSLQKILSLINMIIRRGHVIGFHPSFFSVESINEWSEEKKEIERISEVSVNEGRQHYLRFTIPETFSFWENNNMLIESTLSYFDIEGFRCGTGDAFPVFNFLERKEYKLKERPLIVMDSTLVGYRGLSLDQVSETLDYFFSVGQKYKMPITLLFHNSSFTGYKGRQLLKVYKDSIVNKKN